MLGFVRHVKALHGGFRQHLGSTFLTLVDSWTVPNSSYALMTCVLGRGTSAGLGIVLGIVSSSRAAQLGAGLAFSKIAVGEHFQPAGDDLEIPYFLTESIRLSAHNFP